MTSYGKDTVKNMGFPSNANWDENEDVQVEASYAELAELIETGGKTCPICGLPINKRTHPWNAKYGCK